MAALLAAGWQFSWFAVELISPHFQVVGASVAHAPADVARPLLEQLMGVPAHGERHQDGLALGHFRGRHGSSCLGRHRSGNEFISSITS